jgi:hypothetical protein
VPISVWNCRASVCRLVRLDAGYWTYEFCQNWEELEDRAIREVEAQGGAVNISGLYPCPADLFELARFPSSDRDI